MKYIFLSFNPKYYKPILYGIKKYEYRKRFCKEETIAYLYLSSPERKIIGIMKLGIPLVLKDLRELYKSNKELFDRINNYINKGEVNAVPIKSLQLFKESISLNKLRETFNGFMPPQSYYLLDNKKDLFNYLKKIPLEDPIVIHEHNNIYEDNIAVSCSEIEQSEEYKKRNN